MEILIYTTYYNFYKIVTLISEHKSAKLIKDHKKVAIMDNHPTFYGCKLYYYHMTNVVCNTIITITYFFFHITHV